MGQKITPLDGIATQLAWQGRGAAFRCALRRTGGRTVVQNAVFEVVRFLLISLRNRPSLLSHSPAAAFDRPHGPASRRARRHGCALSSPASPVMLTLALRVPRLSRHQCSMPKPRHRPFGGVPCAAFFEAAPKGKTSKGE